MNSEVASSVRAEGKTIESRLITVQRLDDALEESGIAAGFGLLKIDVEGFESQVLQGIDLHRWRPKCILIESTRPNTMSEVDSAWNHLIDLSQYQMILFDGVNKFYVHRAFESLARLVSIPANSIDNYLSVFWYNRLPVAQRPIVKLTPWPL